MRRDAVEPSSYQGAQHPTRSAPPCSPIALGAARHGRPTARPPHGTAPCRRCSRARLRRSSFVIIRAAAQMCPVLSPYRERSLPWKPYHRSRRQALPAPGAGYFQQSITRHLVIFHSVNAKPERNARSRDGDARTKPRQSRHWEGCVPPAPGPPHPILPPGPLCLCWVRTTELPALNQAMCCKPRSPPAREVGKYGLIPAHKRQGKGHTRVARWHRERG